MCKTKKNKSKNKYKQNQKYVVSPKKSSVSFRFKNVVYWQKTKKINIELFLKKI